LLLTGSGRQAEAEDRTRGFGMIGPVGGLLGA
jgi:hypothetical protein